MAEGQVRWLDDTGIRLQVRNGSEVYESTIYDVPQPFIDLVKSVTHTSASFKDSGALYAPLHSIVAANHGGRRYILCTLAVGEKAITMILDAEELGMLVVFLQLDEVEMPQVYIDAKPKKEMHFPKMSDTPAPLTPSYTPGPSKSAAEIIQGIIQSQSKK